MARTLQRLTLTFLGYQEAIVDCKEALGSHIKAMQSRKRIMIYSSQTPNQQTRQLDPKPKPREGEVMTSQLAAPFNSCSRASRRLFESVNSQAEREKSACANNMQNHISKGVAAQPPNARSRLTRPTFKQDGLAAIKLRCTLIPPATNLGASSEEETVRSIKSKTLLWRGQWTQSGRCKNRLPQFDILSHGCGAGRLASATWMKIFACGSRIMASAGCLAMGVQKGLWNRRVFVVQAPVQHHQASIQDEGNAITSTLICQGLGINDRGSCYLYLKNPHQLISVRCAKAKSPMDEPKRG
uniref:Uncharacterized protein n=1 Tax=Ditylenchus dipsaci TaxID=166011 RepID=A0A915E7M0_9BILA